MTKLISQIMLILIAFTVSAQETTIRYYRSITLQRETEKEKARYKTVTTSIDDFLQIDLYQIDTGKLILHKSFHKSKPYGKWYAATDDNTLHNYLEYGRFVPPGYYAYDFEKEQLKDSILGNFTKPSLTGVDENILKRAKIRGISVLVVWINVNIQYPVEAQTARIQGEVRTQFTIDETGSIGNIRIIEGVHEILDSESYRLLKSLPRMLPAKLDDKPVKLYVEVPIRFLQVPGNQIIKL